DPLTPVLRLVDGRPFAFVGCTAGYPWREQGGRRDPAVLRTRDPHRGAHLRLDLTDAGDPSQTHPVSPNPEFIDSVKPRHKLWRCRTAGPQARTHASRATCTDGEETRCRSSW